MLSELRVSKRMKSVFTFLFSAMAILGGTLQGALAEETRWYDVEVIVFSHNSKQYRNSELWPVDYELPQTEKTQALLPSPSATSKAVAFSRLAPSSLQLTSEAARIKSAPDMDVLLHTGWRQPGLPEDKAVAVEIDTDSDQRVSGTLKLVLSRYLHINTDLVYREPLSDSENAEPYSVPADVSTFSFEPRYQAYHMKQSRRMRSREIHYLDHPLFGMAILVTPYEAK